MSLDLLMVKSLKFHWKCTTASIAVVFIFFGLLSCAYSRPEIGQPSNRNMNVAQDGALDNLYELNDYYGEIRTKFKISDSLISSLENWPPKSPWIESEKRFYQDLLKKSNYDILIVPFQTQHDGIDSVGRMLMSYYLAIAIEQNTDLKVAPLSIVYPALGRTARYFEENDVKMLADQIGVSRIVWGYAGTHTRKDKKNKQLRKKFPVSEDILFDYTVVDQKYDSSTKEVIERNKKWYNQPITPEILPSKLFEDNLYDIMNFLGFSYDDKKSAGINQSKHIHQLPDRPKEILNIGNKDRIKKSYLLQFLGMLAPTVDHKNYLFALSVINMFPIEKENVDRRLIESRAYIHLYRRPAARKAIEGLHSSEAESLRDYIDANLPELENSVAKLPSSIKKLLSELELFYLRNKYNDDLTSKEKNEYLNKYPNWNYLLSIRLSHYDSWHRASNIDLKLLMDEIFPVQGFSAMDLSVGHNIANSSDAMALKSNMLFKKHIQLYLNKSSNMLVSANNKDINLSLSVLTLMESVGIFNLLQEIYFWGMTQGMPDKGLEICENVLREYNGHPYFVAYKARVLRIMMKKRSQVEKMTLQENAFYLSLDAMWWNGSQNWVHRYASKSVFPVPNLRPLYIMPEALLNTIGSDYPFRVNVVKFRNLRPLESLLPWAHTDMQYHSMLYQFNFRNENIASQVVSDIERRFNGSPRKKRFLIKNKITEDNNSNAKEILVKEIDSGTQDWHIYKNLARLYINEEKYNKAKEVLMTYEDFKTPNKSNSVEISNLAHTAAGLFYWKGAIEQAKHFFKLSADQDSGSAMCMHSQERLSLIDGDYQAALRLSLDRAKRYDSYSAYNNYMTYLHLMGKHDIAWSLFKNLIGRYNKPYLWDSAFIGKRLRAIDKKELIKWAREISDMDKSIQKKQFPVRFLIMNLMDRDPDMGMVDSIEILEKETKDEPPRQIVHHTKNGKIEKRWQEPIMHYTLFAKAYENIKLQHYNIAYENLKKIVMFYGFGNKPEEKLYSSYLVWTGLKSGHEKEIQQLVNIYLIKAGARGYSRNLPPDIKKLYDSIPADKLFDINLELSLAAYYGASEKYDEAYKHLINSFNAHAESSDRPTFPLHQIFEYCGWIHNASNDDRFSNLALRWSKKLQVAHPMLANLYIVEAKYAKIYDDIVRAVGIAQYLDANSASLKKFDKKIRNEAGEWMKKNNPFKKFPKKDGIAI